MSLKHTMRTYLTLVILALSTLAAGCASKSAESFSMEEVPPLSPGVQRFTGISDDHCKNEWEAYQQAWERAMEQVARFASTRVVSKIVDWARQETRQMVLEESVLGVQDIQTHFESEASLNTNVTLHQVYESQYYREQHRDGTWKARIVLLAQEDKLLADARKALAKLEEDLESARSNAERSLRMLKAQIREKMQGIETEKALPQRLELLSEALEPHKRFQATEASIQKARQAYAAGDGVLALVTYKEIPECTEDMPDDSSPVPNVQHAYQETWNSIKDAAGMLESAQKYVETRELMRAQKLLDEFDQRMGSDVEHAASLFAAGSFTHVVTGETLTLSPLPSLLREHIDALQQKTDQASQRAESAFTGGDVLNAMQDWHEALKTDRDNSQAQQRLDQAVRTFAAAALEADPVELEITSRVAIEESLIVSLKTSDGQSLPMPIAFRFQEGGVDAEMITDLLDGVSTNGTLTIKRVHQSPDDTNRLHLLATPAPQAMSNLDRELTARLQSVLENHIISIPITLKPPSLGVLLNLTSADMSQERISQFRRSLEDKLQQKKYSIVGKSDVNTMEVHGDVSMSSVPIGSLVTLNLSINLGFWHDSRAIAENVKLSSGAQVDASEDEAFSVAQRIVIQECVAEIEKQISQALGK